MQCKNKASKKRISGIALLLGIFCFGTFFSCSSTKNTDPILFDSSDDFIRRELTNNIPVIFKQNRGSKIIVLRLVFEGGTSAIDESLGGIEDLTFDLMLRGTENYPYETIQRLEYEKSFSLTASSGKDYSSFGFMCIQRDLSEVLGLFADCVLNPAFLESDYNQKMKQISSEIASKKADPSGTLGLSLSKVAFSGHPYATTSSITEETYQNINLNLIKGIHQSLLNALRLKIIVVGNFNDDFIDDFTDQLNTAFGKSISRRPFSVPKIPKIPLESGTLLVKNEQAGNTGYIAGLFSAPSRSESDYIPFAIATMYLDDIFFSQVREKAGAVYSINTGVIGGKELLGVISVYKATEKKTLKKLLVNAIDSFDSAVLTKNLDQYKNKYITSIYSSSQTASGVAGAVVSSLEYFGSESAYINRIKLVQNVKAEDVLAAYKKYIEPISKKNAVHWVVVDSEENLSDYDF